MKVLTDTFRTTLKFGNAPGVHIKEKAVTPPGARTGGTVDTTTQRNNLWETRSPKKLKSLKDAGGTCSYDPAFYTDIMNQMGKNQLFTVTWEDGAELDFWGWLDDFTPRELEVKSTDQPTASFVIIPSNQDTDLVEQAPVYRTATTSTATTTTTLP